MKLTTNKTYRSFDDVVVEYLNKTPKRAESFLNHVLKEYQEDGDEKALFIALKQVAAAKGVILSDLIAELNLQPNLGQEF